jgi:hypothetical protein
MRTSFLSRNPDDQTGIPKESSGAMQPFSLTLVSAGSVSGIKPGSKNTPGACCLGPHPGTQGPTFYLLQILMSQSEIPNVAEVELRIWIFLTLLSYRFAPYLC